MRYRVLKEFVTPLHRYMAGAEFDESDADPVLDFEHLTEHGHLKPMPPPEELPIGDAPISGEPSEAEGPATGDDQEE